MFAFESNQLRITTTGIFCASVIGLNQICQFIYMRYSKTVDKQRASSLFYFIWQNNYESNFNRYKYRFYFPTLFLRFCRNVKNIWENAQSVHITRCFFFIWFYCFCMILFYFRFLLLVPRRSQSNFPIFTFQISHVRWLSRSSRVYLLILVLLFHRKFFAILKQVEYFLLFIFIFTVKFSKKKINANA